MTIWALVDGGGSKTRIRVIDAATGDILSESRSGPGNLTLGADTVWTSILAGLENPGVPQPAHIFAGLAGVESIDAREAFLMQARWPTTLISDRDSGLCGALLGAPGACLTVGTGVALSWLAGDGVVHRRGGLGFVLGDEGGGAWIGRRVVQLLAYHADRGLLDGASEHVAKALGMGVSLPEWVAFGQQAKPADFAALAPMVFTLADAGEALPKRVIDEGVAALIDLLSAVPSDLPIALVGGLTGCYVDRLREFGLPIVDAKGDALDGLWLDASGRVTLNLQRWSTHEYA